MLQGPLPLLELRDLSLIYPDSKTKFHGTKFHGNKLKGANSGTNTKDSAGIRNVSFHVQPGEGFSLLGPSGCGKSTTLRLIGGFEQPQSGQIFFEGRDITHKAPQERDIRTVFQRYALFPHLDVYENVVFGLRTKKIPTAQIEKKADQFLELLEIARHRNQKISRLSGGEQQRVALARALITEPKVLLLDEPLSALDLKLREKMQLELLALRRNMGLTFVFVTHDQSEAMTLSDRIAVMNRNRIEQIGSPEEIYNKPLTRFVASFIGQANFITLAHGSLLRFNCDPNLVPALDIAHDWMLRPENLIIRSKGARLPLGYISIPGKLIEMIYLGQNRLAKVLDPLGHSHLVVFPGHEIPKAVRKEEIQIAWKGDSVCRVASENTSS